MKKQLLKVLMLVLAIGAGTLSVWGGQTWIEASSKDVNTGLVYASTSTTNPAIEQYTSPSTSGKQSATLQNVAKTFYIWAMPARGYRFSTWTEKGGQASDPESQTGTRDVIKSTTPKLQNVAGTIKATFAALTAYNVTYEQPVGGSYTVKYEYYTVNTSTNKFFLDGQTQQLTPTSGNWKPEDDKTYATDNITLSTENTNFIGWYKNGEFLSSANPYTEYKAGANDVISAQFKEIGWGNVTGDLAVNVTAKGTYGGKVVYVACPTLIGSWTSSDFTISPKVAGDANDASNEYGSIEFGAITLNTAESRLEIPYTYVASGWGGISVDVTVTPAYGEPKQFTIAAYAEEVVDYEACIEEEDVRTYTGTLAEMMTQANSMDNKPTLKLMQNKTITAPLSFTNSFTFDVNGRTLTANCASAFSIDAAGKDVKIIDGSFTQVGEIHTSYASSGAVSVVTFTQAAKLTMQGGTLSATNTGSGSAYGVNVCQGSIFYMSNGQLTVSASTGNAQGVHVATASDYATFNGGSLTVSAPTNAYGLWSAGQSNITNATIHVETTTGTNAYGVYIDGGTSTLANNTIIAYAKTTNAYGAYVNAGRLNDNGGSFAASAVTDKVYGVYVAADATTMLQQKATVTAAITTGNGGSDVEVCGINNLGTVSLYNISVTATSATNYATAIITKTGAVSTTIEGGTYIAQTGTHHAFGANHQCGTINVDGGTFKAISETNASTGFRAGADGAIANATISAESTTSETAFGLSGATENKNITVTNCTINAKVATTKAYAIYSRANVTVVNCSLDAKTMGGANARGFYAEKGTNTLTNCNATVSSSTIQACGVYHEAGSVTINGGEYVVEAKQSTAAAAQTAELYGIYNAASQTTTVDGATFRVTAPNNTWSQYAHAAYINGVLNSTNATYEATGRTIVYAVYGLGSSTLNLSGNTITSTVTSGSKSYGIYAKKNFTINGDIVSAVGPARDIYAMYFDATNSVGEVLAGKFSAQGNGTYDYGALNASGTAGKVKLKGGVYKTTFNLGKYAYTGYQIYHLDETHPDYAGGYRYTIAAENPSPYVCRIVNGAYYATLEAAMQYTLDNSGTYTIVMTQSYTLPAGDYTLPSNATLVIPYKFGQNAITVQGTNPANPDTRTTAGLKENFLCLTLANGANINVNGKIGVGAEMYCTQSANTSYINGPYGQIKMEAGSHIQLNSGAYLYAWGMITGTGTIAVKNNAEVREMFRLSDMKDPSNLKDYYMNNSQDYFPVTQYSIQNIEVPTTYYYNSRLYGAMLCYYSGLGGIYYGEKNIKIVGTSGALFQVTTNDESSWVRKSYKSSYQVWDINSSAQLGSISMTIDIMGIISTTFNSADYILPITHTMKIHVLDGDFEITHDSELLPGASIEVDKTASLTVKSGQKVYIFDNDQWPSTTSRADAAINVHGNINLNGALYTTRSIAEGTNATYGANIYSTNADAGTVSFRSNAPATTASVDLITGIDSEKKQKIIKTVTMDPALLKNGDGSYTPTSGTVKTHAFAYMNNVWQETYTNECFEVIGEDVYVKPSGYVKLKKSQIVAGLREGVEEPNHTYLTIDDKLLIRMLPDCQWWEVEATDDPTVFECKKAGYEGFYYYDDSSETWKLKTVSVKFYSAEEGEDVLKTIVTDYKGIPDQAVIAVNPTKATTAEYTYQFYGWKSSATGTEYPWTATLEVATSDMSYRPVFTKTKRNYTVTFVNANNGANVPVETPYGEHPSCDPIKDATAQYTYYFLNWTDANSNSYAIDATLPKVTGATSYTAHWSSIVNRYTITWVDGETVLETDKHQLYGSTTAFNGMLPTKATDNNFVYAFSGWRSSMTGQTYANGSTPNVAGETTYEALFSTTSRYMITFNNYNGDSLQKEPVTVGETPIYNGVTPARARDFDGYFVFTGWENTDGEFFAKGATLPAVVGKETYTAQYSYTNDLFLITLNNVDGNGASWQGKFGLGATPFYNPNNNDIPVIPEKEGNAQYSYPFTGWSPELEPVSATSTKEYTAQFGQEINSYDITFANLDGNGASQTIKVEYGQTPVCPVTPTKDDGINSYPFEGWNTPIVAVTGEATYTAQFSATPIVRQFDITFDLDNGSAVTIVPVTYGTTPEWTGETPTKPATAQYTYTFAGWYPTFVPVTGEETYIAQYTETLNSYTVTFMNRGETLLSSSFQYGTAPTKPAEPKAWVDEEHSIAYSFAGWSDGEHVYAHNAIPAVTGDVTYTAQYTEFANLVATVTTSAGVTTPYNSWDGAFGAANGSANCTLKLYKNVTVSTFQTINRNMTIDLNGFEIKRESGNTLFTFSDIALTINDSKGGGRIYLNSSSNSNPIRAVAVAGNGSVTINGGTIEAYSTYDNNNAVATPIFLNSANAKLYLYGGELISNTSRSGAKAYAVYNNNTSYGYSYIYGGKLHTKTGIFYNGTANRLTIQGGYYNINTNLNTTNFVKAPYYIFNTTDEDKAEVGSDYNYKVAEAYTITFNNWDNSNLSTLQKQIVGTTPAYTGAAPVKEPQSLYTFIGWKNTNDEFFAPDATLPAVAAAETYTAQFSVVEILEVSNVVPIEENLSIETTIVKLGGTLDVKNGVEFTTTNLILEASKNTSGQIMETGTINATNVYFDLKLNTQARCWHAFGVPWNVDVATNPIVEIENRAGEDCSRTLIIGRDYDIVYYDGETRASQGAGAHCWNYLKHYSEGGQPVETMTPGKGYMIAFTSEVGTIRLTKVADAPILFDGTNGVTGGSGDNGGWNAIANPMAYHATLDAGPTVGYVHDGGEIGSDGYTAYDIDDKRYIVGKMVYVQAATDATVVVEPAGEAGNFTAVAAPKRRNAVTDKQYLSLRDYYTVSLTNANGVGSKVYVLPEEDKADEYVIGHDLSQFSMSDKKAQIWVNRYNTQLALNTTAPVNGVAEFPISVYAPQEGEYTLALQSQPEEGYIIYLTQNGEAIWNLSSSAYAVTLNNGTNKTYGLRIVQSNAPAVVTGIDEAIVDAQGQTRKVLINDKVYIIRGENVYSVDGSLVK